MAITDGGATMTMPVAPTGMMGGGFGGENGWWVILFIILLFGWGRNGYGNNNGYNNGNSYNNGYNNGNSYNNGYNSGYGNNGYNNYNNQYGNQYNNGYNQYNNGYNRPPYPSSQNAPSFGTWLTLSILCAVFLNKICGVIGIIFIIMGNNAFKIGNFDDYEKQLKRCKIALLVGLILGILTIVFYVFAFINTSGGMSMYY